MMNEKITNNKDVLNWNFPFVHNLFAYVYSNVIYGSCIRYIIKL